MSYYVQERIPLGCTTNLQSLNPKSISQVVTKLINKIEKTINNETETVDQFEAFVVQLIEKESKFFSDKFKGYIEQENQKLLGKFVFYKINKLSVQKNKEYYKFFLDNIKLPLKQNHQDESKNIICEKIEEFDNEISKNKRLEIKEKTKHIQGLVNYKDYEDSEFDLNKAVQQFTQLKEICQNDPEVLQLLKDEIKLYFDELDTSFDTFFAQSFSKGHSKELEDECKQSTHRQKLKLKLEVIGLFKF